MNKIRILLVEDHAIVRAGLRALLNSRPDMEVAGEASHGQEAVEKTLELNPEIVLMDLTMPGMDGFQATQELRKRAPQVKVLVLTVHEDEAYLFQALKVGALGYVTKSAADSELIAALQTVHRGDIFLNPSATKSLLLDYLRQAEEGEKRESYNSLTEREREILKFVAAGYTSQQIAQLLILSPRTVETHRSHIMEKLGLSKRAQLVDYALRHGLLRPEG